MRGRVREGERSEWEGERERRSEREGERNKREE